MNDMESAKQKSSSFKGDVMRLASGVGAAQLIGILFAPVVSRIFNPDAYGMAALYASVTGIVGVIACLRYEQAIVLPKSQTKAAGLFFASLISSIAIAMLTAVVLGLGGSYLVKAVDYPALSPFLYLVPASVLLSGFGVSLTNWNIRQKRFGRLAKLSVIQAIFVTAFTLCGGLIGFATGGTMIMAGFTTQCIFVAILGLLLWKDHGSFLGKSFDLQRMLAVMRRYQKFPQYSAWQALLNKSSRQVPVLLLGVFFSPAVVGAYSLGFRVLNMPSKLLGNAIGHVFYQRGATAHSRGNLHLLVQETLSRLWKIALYPMVVLGCLGDQLFIVVFGAEWAEAGLFVQVLSPWIFVAFLHSPISSLFNILEVQGVGLLFNVILLTLRTLAIVVGSVFGGPVLALLLFSLASTLAILTVDSWLFTRSGIDWQKLANSVRTSCLLCCGIVAGLLLIRASFDIRPVFLCLIGASLGLPYYACAFWGDEKIPFMTTRKQHS